MNIDRRPLPIGVDDFRDVRENSYYVDKTFLVKDVLRRTPSTCILYARPRRFGKSLSLSMLKYFFELSEEDKEYLFQGTEIYGDEQIWNKHFSSYPVVYLNLKNVRGDDKESLLAKARTFIAEEYQRHQYLLKSDSINQTDKRYIKRIIDSSSSESDLSSSLYKLTRFLYSHYGRRVIVLIDEYDTPLRVAYENGYYDSVIGFFRDFFGETLKSNPNVYYSVLTGILQVSKESLFSGLNNLAVDNVLTPSPREAFGFSEEEVNIALEEYGLADMKGGFKDWYDGYLFGKDRVYNPLSVLSAIQSQKLAPYWVNTSEKGALAKLVTNEGFDANDLIDILSTKEVEADIDLAISYKDLSSSSSYLLSYLLATGYLTLSKEIDDSTCILKIPNKEIDAVFKKEIVERCLPKKANDFPKKLQRALLEANDSEIKSLLEEKVLNSFSYYDLNREKEYQTMVVSLLLTSLSGYKIRSEVNTSLGRSDVIAYSDNPSDPSFIIEIKSFKGKTSSKRMKQASKRAISQIKDRDYSSELNSSASEKIILYGFAFASKSVEVTSEERVIEDFKR